MSTRDRDKEKAEERTRHWEKAQPDEHRLQRGEETGGVRKATGVSERDSEMEESNMSDEKVAVAVMEWNDDGLRKAQKTGKYHHGGGGPDRSFCAAAGQEARGGTDNWGWPDRQGGLPA